MLLNSCNVHYLINNDYSNAIGTYLDYGGAVNYSIVYLGSMEVLQIGEIVSFDGDFDLISLIKRIIG